MVNQKGVSIQLGWLINEVQQMRITGENLEKAIRGEPKMREALHRGGGYLVSTK